MENILDTKGKTYAVAVLEIAAQVPEDKKNDFILSLDMFVKGMNIGKQKKEVSYAESSTN